MVSTIFFLSQNGFYPFSDKSDRLMSFQLWSGNALNLEQTKKLWFDKEIIAKAFYLPNWKHLQMISTKQTMKFVCDKVENIVVKGENASYHHFLLFNQFFHKPFF